MTFKHTKFEDSATMRSLVKVAADKGWVKSEPLKKTASVEEDLSPTTNLTENLVKLCAGLRKSGMDKFANELEDKLIAYKKAANSLYDVSKEKGEDLVDSAHPKGGHTLEGLEGDAHVETILETKLKMIQMVDKKPTGKLASHTNILRAVKIVLAEESVDELEKQIRGQLQAAYATWQKIKKIADEDLTIGMGHESTYSEVVNNSTIDKIKDAKKTFNNSIWTVKPGLITGVSENTWSIMQGLVPKVNGYYDKALELRTKVNAIKAGALEKEDPTAGSGAGTGEKKDDKPLPPPPPHWKNLPDGRSIMSPLYNNFKKIKSLKGTLANLKAIGGIANNTGAMKWIDEEIAALNAIDTRYTAVEWNDNAADLNGNMQAEIAAEEKDINAFKSQWAPSAPAAPVS